MWLYFSALTVLLAVLQGASTLTCGLQSLCKHENFTCCDNSSAKILDCINNIDMEKFIILDLNGKNYEEWKTRLSQRKKICWLSLSENRIAELDSTFLGSAKYLETLNLSNNQLSTLPSNFLKSADNLKTLDLSSNKFHELPKFLRNLPNSLKNLYLQSNQINCTTSNYCDEDYSEAVNDAMNRIGCEQCPHYGIVEIVAIVAATVGVLGLVALVICCRVRICCFKKRQSSVDIPVENSNECVTPNVAATDRYFQIQFQRNKMSGRRHDRQRNPRPATEQVPEPDIYVNVGAQRAEALGNHQPRMQDDEPVYMNQESIWQSDMNNDYEMPN
uniref:leucine-rich repeat-containing protein 40-like n=1 Tax=Myxine glutinosa TaxID=7769 RepID=UPI00358F6033